MKSKLEVQNLFFGYNGKNILHDVSFSAHRGQLISLVGPNGAGKSTLLRCISHLLAPSTGNIHVDGKEISSLRRMDIAKTVAYVPQSIHRVFPQSVFDVVLMGRHPHLGWRSGKKDNEEVWKILELLGLVDLAMSSFNEMSGGQQQKVLIARALAQKTDLILLDEPTSNLDIWHQLDVLNIVHSLVENKGVTVIMAMHDLNLASRYSHALLMLKEGMVIMNGKPHDVITSDNIDNAYKVEAQITSVANALCVVPLRQLPLSNPVELNQA